jgi:hypothetical protein
MTLSQSQPRADFTSAAGEQGASRVINPTFSMEGENLRSAGFDIESLLNDEWSIGGPAVTDDAVPADAPCNK